MKKIILIALSVMLFVGCDDATKTKEVEATPVKATKDIHTEAVEDAKKAVEALQEKAVETTKEVKEAIAPVVEEAKEKVEAVKEKVVETTKEVKEAIAPVVEEAKEKVVEATKEITKIEETVVTETNDTAVVEDTTETNNTVAIIDGAEMFKKCATCHGEDGKKSAFEKSAIIAGQDVETLITSITEYQAGTRDVAKMGKLMSGQVVGLSTEEIKALAEYISTL